MLILIYLANAKELHKILWALFPPGITPGGSMLQYLDSEVEGLTTISFFINVFDVLQNHPLLKTLTHA